MNTRQQATHLNFLVDTLLQSFSSPIPSSSKNTSSLSSSSSSPSPLSHWLEQTKESVKNATAHIQSSLDEVRGKKQEMAGQTDETIRHYNALLNCGYYSGLCLDAAHSHELFLQGEERESCLEIVPVKEVVELCVDRLIPFSQAKNSGCPEFHIHTIPKEHKGVGTAISPANHTGLRTAARPRTVSSLLMISGYIHFALFEFCKNAVSACLKRYGTLDIEETSPPIVITVDTLKQRITIEDEGCGMDSVQLQTLRDYAHSGWEDPEDGADPTYAYSKDFGGDPFSGQGVGFPRALLALRFHEASCHVKSSVNKGTRIDIQFPREKLWEDDIQEAQEEEDEEETE